MRSRTARARVEPMLASASTALPDHLDDWALEVKWDGMRAVAFISDSELRLQTRTGNDVTEQYPDLQPLPGSLRSHDVVLDGEIVAFDRHGRPSFQLLQERMGVTRPGHVRARAASTPASYVAFDVLELDGRDLRDLPYVERRAVLAELLGGDGGRWHAPAHFVGAGEELLAAIVEQGMEGVVAKRLDSPYRERQRTRDWRKVKVRRRQEFVIGGWTEGRGHRADSFGSLLVGYHDESGGLRFAGGVGSGFSDEMLATISTSMEHLARETSLFDETSVPVIPHADKWNAMRGGPVSIHFVEPQLVCEVSFTEFTRAGTLRHPVFRGLRSDKPARDVVREDA